MLATASDCYFLHVRIVSLPFFPSEKVPAHDAAQSSGRLSFQYDRGVQGNGYADK